MNRSSVIPIRCARGNGQPLEHNQVHRGGVARHDIPHVPLMLQIQNQMLGDLPRQRALFPERQQPHIRPAGLQQLGQINRFHRFAAFGENDDKVALAHHAQVPMDSAVGVHEVRPHPQRIHRAHKLVAHGHILAQPAHNDFAAPLQRPAALIRQPPERLHIH